MPEPTTVAATELLPNHVDMDIEALAVLSILKIVGRPDKVNVTITRGRQWTVMEFEVDKTDIGRIIGTRGHTIRAIRSLIGAAAGSVSRKVNIQVVEAAG